ncbi:hypothetical protein QUA76_20715, partial [Microcoleus sp. F8-A4]
KSQKEEGKSQKAGARISVFTNMRCSPGNDLTYARTLIFRKSQPGYAYTYKILSIFTDKSLY